ncbi:MAG TPA: hypothetical protein VIK55_01800 [Paludibacter sp.]
MIKKKENKLTTTKTISPFKDIKLFKKEITDFLNKYKSTVGKHANRISDYFEMSCYNFIVKFYENNDYDISVQNLKSKKYYYKCSPAGLQSNYSFFKVSKKTGIKTYEFEIQHNLAAQSSFNKDIFTNPDITVIKTGSAKTSTTYYEINRRFSYVENKDVITFFEVKNFNPYPELVFNFIGIVNELKKEILANKSPSKKPLHLAPCLMVSGKPNRQTQRIKDSLEERYCINIIYDLFDSGVSIFSKRRQSELKTTGKIK